MRFVLVLLLTISMGIALAYGIGWIVGIVWPTAQKPTFYVLSLLWILIGVTYPFARRRGSF